MSDLVSSKEYHSWVGAIKEKIVSAQLNAQLKVNEVLLQLYWQIGHELLIAQQNQGWGAKVIDRLAADIKKESPENTGFSERNLKYMASFAKAYASFPIVQVSLAQIDRLNPQKK